MWKITAGWPDSQIWLLRPFIFVFYNPRRLTECKAIIVIINIIIVVIISNHHDDDNDDYSSADQGAYSCEAINSQGSCFAGSAGCGQPGQVFNQHDIKLLIMKMSMNDIGDCEANSCCLWKICTKKPLMLMMAGYDDI